ncbi:type II secretion system F family protein [Dethiobacter alkaliphilus]|uniref:Type II secretion system protein n=1 Tax=Dethiobacter alkaliphilus AHT 1 TaxID=555088 RepID=C0GE62_DETAL|nr:type II secretion system F family protein [Dethiobacter alkaliphilus]EEG78356.1 type II secretion system protein [Dethiobacter alkaliphilus AHT 1]
MPLYTYQAMDRGGAVAAGKLEAENEIAATTRLRKMGYTPIDLSEAKVSALSQAFTFKRKVSIGELSLFSRQLAAMLSAGIPLTRCLFALGEQAINPTLRKVVLEVGANVEGGMSFSESLRAHPDVFNDMYVDLVKAGEVGGTLENVLLRLADQLNSEKTLKDNIRTAMFYPTVVLAFAVLVMIGMLVFIVPVFVGFYPDGAELPFLTAVIVGISNSVRVYWYIYLLIALFAVVGLKYYMASEQGKKTFDQIKFKVPIFGDLVQKTVVARFSRTLATLLAGGIPVLQALETAGPASGSTMVEKAVQDTAMKIQEGQSIAEPLKESKLFPPMVTLMISVGEETGDLPSLLNRIAEFYEAEVATMAKGLTALIEPLMIIFVGGIVAVMVISLYLPIFSVITQIQ